MSDANVVQRRLVAEAFTVAIGPSRKCKFRAACTEILCSTTKIVHFRSECFDKRVITNVY